MITFLIHQMLINKVTQPINLLQYDYEHLGFSVPLYINQLFGRWFIWFFSKLPVCQLMFLDRSRSYSWVCRLRWHIYLQPHIMIEDEMTQAFSGVFNPALSFSEVIWCCSFHSCLCFDVLHLLLWLIWWCVYTLIKRRQTLGKGLPFEIQM